MSLRYVVNTSIQKPTITFHKCSDTFSVVTGFSVIILLQIYCGVWQVKELNSLHLSLLTWSIFNRFQLNSLLANYSVSQPFHEVFLILFPNLWKLLVQILHNYYTFQSTLEYKFLFNYPKLWRRFAILSVITLFGEYDVNWVVALNIA